jgi:hypothetical protein
VPKRGDGVLCCNRICLSRKNLIEFECVGTIIGVYGRCATRVSRWGAGRLTLIQIGLSFIFAFKNYVIKITL